MLGQAGSKKIEQPSTVFSYSHPGGIWVSDLQVDHLLLALRNYLSAHPLATIFMIYGLGVFTPVILVALYSLTTLFFRRILGYLLTRFICLRRINGFCLNNCCRPYQPEHSTSEAPSASGVARADWHKMQKMNKGGHRKPAGRVGFLGETNPLLSERPEV